MFNIKTVTMKFDPLEDRLKMDCSDNYKNTQRLWLTKRLLDRLVPSVANQLEAKSTNKISIELEQSFEQEKAEITKTKAKSVKLMKNNPTWLVSSVKVTKSKHNFKFLFIEEQKIDIDKKITYQNRAEFDLAIPNLRQWLNALFKIYKKAEWDTNFFPNWIKDKDKIIMTDEKIIN